MNTRTLTLRVLVITFCAPLYACGGGGTETDDSRPSIGTPQNPGNPAALSAIGCISLCSPCEQLCKGNQ